jgi:hypothetical protein
MKDEIKYKPYLTKNKKGGHAPVRKVTRTRVMPDGSIKSELVDIEHITKNETWGGRKKT